MSNQDQPVASSAMLAEIVPPRILPRVLTRFYLVTVQTEAHMGEILAVW